MTLSDWSSEDWDGEKAKAREQCPLIDFKQLEKQLRQTLQDPIQDVSPNTLDDHTLEKSLSDNLQALTLKEDRDNQNLADTQDTSPEALESDSKKEEKECESSMPKVTEKEQRLQEEEQKYNIRMSTFGYEGDDADLDSEMDTKLEGHAYPFLD